MKYTKLLINNVDYMHFLKSESIELEVNNSDEYDFSFILTPLKQHDIDFLIQSQFGEVKLLDENDNIVYGAILYSIKADVFDKSINDIFYEIEIDTQSYTENCSRISAKWEISPNNPDPDLNAMELAIYDLAEKYLKPKGIIVDKKNIQTGLHTKEIDSEDVKDLKTFTEIMDFIAEKTKSHWYISKEKVFYVDRGIANYSIIDEPFVFVDDVNSQIDKNRHFLSEDFSIEISNEDYFNRLILHGARAGEHYVIDDNFLDENGDLIYQIENKTEQERLSKLNGSDGIVEREEDNSKLDTVENLKMYGDQLIAKYGAPVLKIECKLLDGSIDINIGDFIKIRHNHRFDSYLNTYKPELVDKENLIFCVDSVSDVDYGAAGKIMKELELSQRDENSVNKSFWDIFKNDDESFDLGNEKANIFSNSVTVQMNKAIITDVQFNKIEGDFNE
ncbi:hypothetical protein B5E87_00270 [Massilimicrobiota sp. An142]|uniref:hypothetical protein n=1 Tax=Massilimicrobiota sp. An142 TaxID=1965564 RepID=UPI000B3740F0|nr:hypothetical protein [Massilimicrobiota sp. An142]OUQ15040.1 hypothetical protein B5E87_00270 [Massilimicrobiota sp. An142]